VKLPDFVRTTVFRWISIAFAVCILLFSAIVYWEAAAHMRARMDAAITEESLVIAADTPSRQLNAIEDRLSEDPRRIKLAGLFDADGHRIAGNLESLPPGLMVNATVQDAKAVRVDQRGQESMAVRAIARDLPNGNVLVIARYNGEDKEMVEVMGRAAHSPSLRHRVEFSYWGSTKCPRSTARHGPECSGSAHHVEQLARAHPGLWA
jgi:hypothetical protein